MTLTNVSIPYLIFSARTFIDREKNHTLKITTNKAKMKRKRLWKLGISIFLGTSLLSRTYSMANSKVL